MTCPSPTQVELSNCWSVQSWMKHPEPSHPIDNKLGDSRLQGHHCGPTKTNKQTTVLSFEASDLKREPRNSERDLFQELDISGSIWTRVVALRRSMWLFGKFLHSPGSYAKVTGGKTPHFLSGLFLFHCLDWREIDCNVSEAKSRAGRNSVLWAVVWYGIFERSGHPKKAFQLVWCSWK